MRFKVKAKPNSKAEEIHQIGAGEFIIAVKEPPVQGKANEAVLKALAGYLNISKTRLRIISGWTSRSKIIELAE